MEKKVTFYKAGYWSTFAEINKDGALYINSGDYNNEWYTTVPADQRPALLYVLSKKVALDPACGDDADNQLLEALLRLFKSDEDCPYQAIQAFLNHHLIKSESSCWVSGEWPEYKPRIIV